MYVSKVYQQAVDSYGDVCTLVRWFLYLCPDGWYRQRDPEAAGKEAQRYRHQLLSSNEALIIE